MGNRLHSLSRSGKRIDYAHLSSFFHSMKAKVMCGNVFISVPLEDTRFRKSERLIIKRHFFIKGHSGEYAPACSNNTIDVASLKRNITQSMICSALPKGVSNSS